MKTIQTFALLAVVLTIGCGGGGQPVNSTSVTTTVPANPNASDSRAISSNGYVVGTVAVAGVTHAALFLRSGQQAPTRYTVTLIPTLGGTRSNANAINEAGHVTGWAFVPSQEYHAFFFNGSITDIGLLSGDQDSSGASINNNDVVVGGSYAPTTQSSHGFIWDSTNGLHQINDPLSGTDGVAVAVNDSKTTIGYYNLSGSTYSWYTHPSSGPAQAGGPMAEGYALGINNSGVVVGNGFAVQGTPWTFDLSSNTYTALHTNGGNAFAWAVNNSGEVAGRDKFGSAIHACVWAAGHQTDLGAIGSPNVIDLNTRLSPADQATYHLVEATGINAAGQICCNTGTKGVILTPVSGG